MLNSFKYKTIIFLCKTKKRKPTTKLSVSPHLLQCSLKKLRSEDFIKMCKYFGNKPAGSLHPLVVSHLQYTAYAESVMEIFLNNTDYLFKNKTQKETATKDGRQALKEHIYHHKRWEERNRR